MKHFSLTALAVAVLATFSATVPAQAQFAAGQCVSWGGPIFKVVGPGYPGQTLLQGRAADHASLPASNGQLTAVPCPGAPVAKHTCFASDPDTGKNAIDWAIRHYLATNGARPDQPQTTHFRSVEFGTSREATTPEQVDIGDGDFTQKVIDAHVVYDTCWDDGAIIHLTHFNRNFICFKTKSTKTFACGVKSITDMKGDTTEQFQKY